MTQPLPLLIIGAGPFGLVMAAYARRKDIEHAIVGKPMDFWQANMPKGMFLRSPTDWHFDPFDEDTIERYLRIKKIKADEVTPLRLDFYLGYCAWFSRQKAIEPLPAQIHSLNVDESLFLEATTEGGEQITARNVVVAMGFRYFANLPDSYVEMFPPGRFAHTCDFVDLAALKNKRVLIIGGRQSAFEWAALLREHGADTVYMSYRHPTPEFIPSDWSWVNPLVDGMVADPGFFRRLNRADKDALVQRFWAEGRLKLEPWLAKRISNETIKLLPQSQVTACKERPGGELEVTIDGTARIVDQVILAIGYKVNLSQIPFLANGNLLKQIDSTNGFPVLDEHFQSNITGLFFTSMCATQDFGPFFGFTAAVRTSAKLIGSALRCN